MEQNIENWLATAGHSAASSLLSAVITLVVGILAIRLAMGLLRRGLERSHLEKTAHHMVLSLIRVILYMLLGMMVASALGIDITGVVALTSVLTLAVSLSLQNMLTNVFGGFTLLTTGPFHSGDFVEIAGQSGTVQEIGMAYTRLLTPDQKMISIPNSAVVGAQIVNFSAMESRRLEFSVGASYDAPMEQVLKALEEAADMEGIRRIPGPFAAVKDYGDSAISYILRVWVPTESYWDLYFRINRRIKEVFDARGIEMTYPHLHVHLDTVSPERATETKPE